VIPRRPTWRAGLVHRPVGDHLLVLDPRTHHSCLLNACALAILAHCDGTHTLDEIVRLVAAEFEIPAAAARPGVEETIQSLCINRFLANHRRHGGGGAPPQTHLEIAREE
jgi:hypothetical protein